MATPSLAEDQLIELLLQLKKTTPDAARQILNSKPQIAYALISLMVKPDAVDIHVLQKTLSDFRNANSAPPPQTQQPAAPPQTQVPSAAPTSVAPAPSAPTPAQQPYYQHQQSGYHRDTPPTGGTNGYREDMYRGAATTPIAPNKYISIDTRWLLGIFQLRQRIKETSRSEQNKKKKKLNVMYEYNLHAYTLAPLLQRPFD